MGEGHYEKRGDIEEWVWDEGHEATPETKPAKKEHTVSTTVSPTVAAKKVPKK